MRPKKIVPTVFLGSGYGGWHVVADRLGPRSIVYSGGVGRDASFDEALITTVGCSVHAFDPTPVGRAFAETVSASNRQFLFHPWGLWNEDRVVDFFVPAGEGRDSYSIVNLGETESSAPGVVRRLGTIMRELGHDHIDLLKIDIEGAEHAVLDDVLSHRLPIEQICVEFDQPSTLGSIYRLTRRLERAGYRLVNRTQWDHTFIRSGAANPS